MRGTLKARLLVVVTLLVCTVTTIVMAVFGWTVRSTSRVAMVNQREVMTDVLRRKGLAIVRNVADTTGRAIAGANLFFPVEVLRTTLHQDTEFVYGIVMDKERRAVVHTDPSQADKILDSPVDRFAAYQTEATSQSATWHGDDVMEVLAPITVAGERWGTVRFGLTLRNLRAEIERSESAARAGIATAIASGVGASAVLALIGLVCALAVGARIVQPLETLMAAAQRIQAGDLNACVVIRGSHELAALGRAFNAMAEAIAQREQALELALREARHANMLKSQFLANVSHELRTPLNAIINMPAGLLKDFTLRDVWHCERCDASFQSDDEVAGTQSCPECGTRLTSQPQVLFHGDPALHQRFLQSIERSGKHLLAIVSDVLDMSKLEAGKVELALADTDAAALARAAAEKVQPLAQAKQITLRVEAPDRLPMRGDALRLEQVIINLLGNALKFTPPGGTVHVRAAAEGDAQARLEVEDNGPGIPADKLETIFESFQQVDSSHTRAHGGTGLGLTITRQLVGLHGGTVTAQSELGRWSRFVVLLPRVGPQRGGGVS